MPASGSDILARIGCRSSNLTTPAVAPRIQGAANLLVVTRRNPINEKKTNDGSRYG
jgi:hypothetical protein